MVSRRQILRTLAVSGAVGLGGCSTFIGSGSDRDTPPERTQTTVLTPTPTVSTPTQAPVTGTATPTPTPTVAEQIGTPVYRADSGVDDFGEAVALSSDTAIVVAAEHGASVFEAGNDGWTNTTVLLPTDREDFGGHAVSATVLGETAVIGGPEAGAAYRFERTDDGWNQTHRFHLEETRAGQFGRSLAFDGDRVVVGDANEPTTMVSYVGGASVFARESDGWTLEASLTTGDQDLFGTAVAVDGETLLVGAPFAEPDGTHGNPGGVYVYERDGKSWQQEAVLTPADLSALASDGRFGHAVALDGDTAVVGAPEIPRGAGRAYVFERTDGGWSQAAALTAPDVSEGAEFGRSVALVDGTAVVGAPQAHETGRAYVFTADDGWSDALRLAPADPHPDAEFGAAVSLAGTSALVGAPVYRAESGAYLFDLA